MADNSRKVYTTPDGVEYPRTGAFLPNPDLSRYNAGLGAKALARRLSEFPREPLEDAVEWAVEHYEDNTARDIGSEAHQLIDDAIKGRTPSIVATDEALNAFEAWERWSRDNVAEYVANELSLISTIRGYGGTIDAIGRMKDGRLMLLDWKTGSGFYDSYPLQVAAYVILAREHGYMVDGAMVIRLPKEVNGEAEVKDYTDRLNQYEVAWLGCVQTYYNLKPRRLKNNPIVKEIWGK